MILLTLSHIYKSFVMNRVLTDVNLTLAEGSRMGLVGVNGSGKSTLFQIIAGVLKPDEGTVSMMKGKTIGYLTQHADIDSSLTVTEELSRVFDDVKRMEARLREMEQEMAECHEDHEKMAQLSSAYDRLMARSRVFGGKAQSAGASVVGRRKNASYACKASFKRARSPSSGRADQPSGSGKHPVAGRNTQKVQGHGARHLP